MTITHSSARLDIAPTSGYIGAEISGVDLGGQLDAATVAEIRSALLAYKVIFFRDQRIGHAEQIAFARLFGKVTAAHPHEENPPEGFPEILPIDSRRYEAQLGRKRTSYDSSWHTDVTALVNPPAASILRAHILPPYGGDTAFANLVAAYENLPKGLRDFADTLDARTRSPRGPPQAASGTARSSRPPWSPGTPSSGCTRRSWKSSACRRARSPTMRLSCTEMPPLITPGLVMPTPS